jgi:hypothetical protein
LSRCPEDTILTNILEKYLQDSKEVSRKIYGKLEAYRKAGLDSVVVLMKAEGVSHSDKKYEHTIQRTRWRWVYHYHLPVLLINFTFRYICRFYKLDLNQSLKDNLIGKTIVEFPQLYIGIEGFVTTKAAPLEVPETKKKQGGKTEKNLLVPTEISRPVFTGDLNDEEDELELGSSSSSSSSLGSDDDVDLGTEILVPFYRDLIKQ